MKRDFITILSVIIFAVVIIGEVVVYTSGTDDFNIDATKESGNVEYTISVNGAQVYTVLAMDNGSMKAMDEIYIYYDRNYATRYEYDVGAIGSTPFTHDFYIDQLVKLLRNASSTPVRILSADELAKAMDDDIGTPFQKGLVVVSGALPDKVYGDSKDVDVFDWLNDGGRLYWAGNLLGKYIATADGIETASSVDQNKFFADSLNTGDTSFVDKDDETNTLRYNLSLKNNDVRYGINVAQLPAGTNYRTAGYTDGVYSSVAMVEYGNGMVCVLGGNLKKIQCSDMSQLLSSNVVHTTEVKQVFEGDVQFGKVTGKIDVSGFTGNVSIYAYLGGYFQVYGRHFSF